MSLRISCRNTWIWDLDKPPSEVFYLPIHAVYKDSSTTPKVRAVFNASSKSSTKVSLNDILLVGPTVHPPLIELTSFLNSDPIVSLLQLMSVRCTERSSLLKRGFPSFCLNVITSRHNWRLSYDESHFWSCCLIFCCQHGSQAECSGFHPRISNGSLDSRDFVLYLWLFNWSGRCGDSYHPLKAAMWPVHMWEISTEEVELE